MRRIVTIFIALVILVALGAYWYEEQQAEQSIQVPKISAIPVQVAVVARKAVSSEIKTVGVLKAWRQIRIAPQMDGKVVSISYVPGTYVPVGTVLIQLDDRIYRAKLQAANSALRLAKMNYQRAVSLARTGAMSRQSLDQMRAAFHEATAAVDTAKTMLAETSIKAPFDGYVGPKNVSIGDYVHKGQALTTLTDRSKLLVTYHLSERYLPRLRLGQKVQLEVPNREDVHVTGKVTYLSPIIDTDTHSVMLQATADNSKNQLTPGLFVKVKQVMGIHQHALVVPQASIVPTITGPTVYIIRHGKAELVKIQTGVSFGANIEVTKGLKVGEHVVIAGQQQLKDGAQVKEVKS